MNTTMNATEFLKAVDHASGMNDRWLFLAAFLLLTLGCGTVIFWPSSSSANCS